MKIYVKHISNTFNYGSAMMGIVLMSRLHVLLHGKVKFYTDASGENLTRLITSTGVQTIYTAVESKDEEWIKTPNILKIFKLPQKVQRSKARWQEIAKGYDAIMVLGGDDFSEYYGTKHLLTELIQLRCMGQVGLVFLVGQTIGPFYSYRKLLAQWCFRAVRIYTRDSNCYHYLQNELKLRKIADSRDLAFIELPYQYDQVEKERVVGKYQLPANKYITIVPSGLVKSYIGNHKVYVAAYAQMITKLCALPNRQYEKIVLLPHVFSNGADDADIIQRIMKELPEEGKRNVICILDKMLPYEARIILGEGVFTIAGRMHAAVSTFQMRKPAISLSYSVKYAGVIGEGLDMKELVIESAGDELWEKGIIVDAVLNKAKYIMANYNDLILKISEKVSIAARVAEESVSDIAKRLER